jgi:3-isopropylmalate dehydrogenase
VLAGDFIGPEVIDATLEVLAALAPRAGMAFDLEPLPFGGHAIDAHGTPLPEVTKAGVLRADAVLMGASGGPVGDHPWNRCRASCASRAASSACGATSAPTPTCARWPCSTASSTSRR